MNCAFDLDCLIGAKPKKRRNGCFLKGNVPHNKGKKWDEWLSAEKQERIRGYLRIGRKGGNPQLAGWNKKHVIASKDGRELWFESATHAARASSLIRRNISHCANGERKTCGGWRFRWTETEQH